MVCNLPRSSSKSWTKSLKSTHAFLPPTTHKLMDSVNEQSRHSSSTYTSTATIGKTVGKHAYLLQNLPIMPQPPLPTNFPPTEVSMPLIHASYTSITTANSPPPLQKNGITEWLQGITTSTTSSNESTTNKVTFILKKLDTSIWTIGSWLAGETTKWRLGTINHELANV